MIRDLSEYSGAINQGLPPEDLEGRKVRLQQMLLELGGFKRPPIPEPPPAAAPAAGAPKPKPAAPPTAPPVVKQAQVVYGMSQGAKLLPGIAGGAFSGLTEALAGEWAVKNGLAKKVVEPPKPLGTNAPSDFSTSLLTEVPVKTAAVAQPLTPTVKRPETYVDTYKPIVDKAAADAGVSIQEREAMMPVVDRALAYLYAKYPSRKGSQITEQDIREGLKLVSEEEERPLREAFSEAVKARKTYEEGPSIFSGGTYKPKPPGTFEEYKAEQEQKAREDALAEASPLVAALAAPFQGTGDVGKFIGRGFFSAANTAGFNLPSAVDPGKYRLLMDTLSSGALGDVISESLGSVVGFLRGLGVVRGGVQGIRSLSATGAAERILQDSPLASKLRQLPIPGIIESNKRALELGATMASYQLPARIVEVSGGHKSPELAATETLIDFLGGTLAGKTRDAAIALVRNAGSSTGGKEALAKFYNAMGQMAIGTAQEGAYSAAYGQPFDFTRAMVNSAQNFILSLPDDLKTGIAVDDIHSQLKKFQVNEQAIEEANYYDWQYDRDQGTYTRAAESGEAGYDAGSRVTATEAVRDILEARRNPPKTDNGADATVAGDEGGAQEINSPEDLLRLVPEANGGQVDRAENAQPESVLRADNAGEGPQETPSPNRGRVVEVEGKLPKYERAPGEGLITRKDKSGKERRGIAFHGTRAEALAIDKYAIAIEPGKKKADSNLWLIDERHVVTPETFGQEPPLKDVASYKEELATRAAETELAKGIEAEAAKPTKASSIPIKDRTTFVKVLQEIAPQIRPHEAEDLSVILDRVAQSFKVLRGADYNLYDEISLSNKPIEGHPDTLETAAPPLYQGENASAFYSALDKFVSDLKQEQFSVGQLKGQLAKAPGIKPEEINWRGLDQFISGREKISKQEVIDYLTEHQIALDEVEYGEKYFADLRSKQHDIINRLKQLWDRSTLPENERARIEGHISSLRERERALIEERRGLLDEDGQLDETNRNRWSAISTEIENLSAEISRSDLMHLSKEQLDEYHALQEKSFELMQGSVDYSMYTTPGTWGHREIILRMPSLNYTSPHFRGVPGYLAHIRTTEARINGKRTLFVEEVQSDIHQKGRKEGYYSPDEVKILDDFDRRIWAAAEEEDRNEVERLTEDRLQFMEERDLIRLDRGLLRGVLKVVPDAPFKKAWPELAMKKVLDLAAREGYDQVAWTSGEAQAARWSGYGEEGLKVLYDKILPETVNKHVRRYGVVEQTLSDPAIPEGLRGAHVVEVTPQMRSDITSKGQPLFQSIDKTVYHGTAHEFDKFSLKAIGTGEGVQAFGYGLYATDSRRIAETYAMNTAAMLREAYGGMPIISYQGVDISDPADVKIFTKPEDKGAHPKDVAITAMREMLFDAAIADQAPPNPSKILRDWGQHVKFAEEYIRKAWGEQPEAIKELKKLKPEDFAISDLEVPRIIYEASLKGTFVDQDAAPDSEPELYGKFVEAYKGATGGGLPKDISTWEEAYKSLSMVTSPERASDLFLNYIGIDAMRYEAGTVSGTREPGVYNYVAMNPDALLIKNKTYFQERTKGAVQFLADGHAIVHVFSSGDVSTVIHELGHVARRNLDEASRNVLEDAYGIKDGIWAVEHEEAFARGLERYVRDGVVPDDPKLLPVFRRIAAFMRELYRSLKGSPLEKRIPDEAKLIYDELLGDRAQARDRVLELSEQISFARDMAEAMPYIDEQAYLNLTMGDDAPTTIKLINDAVTTRGQQGSGLEEYRGVQDRADVRQNEGQIRQEEGGQAGDRSGVGQQPPEATAPALRHHVVKEANALAEAAMPKPGDVFKLPSDTLYQTVDEKLKPSDPKVAERLRAADISTAKAAKDQRSIIKKAGSLLTEAQHVFSRRFRDINKNNPIFAQTYFGLMKAIKGAEIAKDFIALKMRRIIELLSGDDQYLMRNYLIAGNELENRRYGNISHVANDIVKHYDETGSLKGVVDSKWLTEKGIEIPKNAESIAPISRLIARAMLDDGLVTVPPDSVPLKFGWTDETLSKDWANWSAEVEARPHVKQAIEDWRSLRQSVADEYARKFGIITGGKVDFNRVDYFHQRTLLYLLTQPGAASTGKPTSRGTKFRQRRKETELDYSTNVWEAQYYALSSLAADSKFYDFIIDEYNRTSVPILEKIEQVPDNLPEGYRMWKPPYGTRLLRPFDPTVVGELKAADVDAILDDALGKLTGRRVSMQNMREAGGIFDRFIVRDEVASTLDRMFRPKPGEEPSAAMLKSGYRSAYNWWKWYTLNAPQRFFRAFTRNLVGDSDKLGLNFGAVKELKTSWNELYNHIFEKDLFRGVGGSEPAGPILQGWIERGGLQNLMGIQENIAYSDGISYMKSSMLKGDIESSGDYVGLLKGALNIIKSPLSRESAYGRKVNQLNNFRESWQRYAHYRSYLDQIQKRGKPDNYGASKPEYVDALASAEDKAWELSNRLMGAYDETTEAGVWIAKNIVPFWRFREANIKSYIGAVSNVFRNPANAHHVAETVTGALGEAGTKRYLERAKNAGILTGVAVLKAGKFILGANLLSAVFEAINLAQSDREKQLGPKAHQESHVLLSGSKDDTYYFNRLSTFSEFLESMGLASHKRDMYDVLTGQKSLQDVLDEWTEHPGKVALDWVKNITNYWAQGSGWPTVVVGLIDKKSLYPDIYNPRRIRDPIEPLTSFMGVDEYWKAISPIPDNMKMSDVPIQFFIYKMEHRKRNYDLVRDQAMKYAMDNLGVNLGGGSYDEEGANYAYYMRQGIKLKDPGSSIYYLKKWVRYKLGDPTYELNKGLDADQYTKLSKAIMSSFRHLDPLSFIPEAERPGYIASLSPEDKAKLADALAYINELGSNDDLYKKLREEAGAGFDQWDALLHEALSVPVESIEEESKSPEKTDSILEEEFLTPRLPLPGNSGNYRKFK